MDTLILNRNAEKAGQLLRVLANPSRLMILCHLGDGELAVQEIQARLGIGQSALSQHLAVLRRERLVTTRRQGQSIYYALDNDDAQAVLDALCAVFCDKPG